MREPTDSTPNILHPQKDNPHHHEGGDGVPNSWVDSWLTANLYLPQSQLANHIVLGTTIVEALATGETTWSDFENAFLSRTQLERALTQAQKAHAAFGIKPPALMLDDVHLVWKHAKQMIRTSCMDFLSQLRSEGLVQGLKNNAVERFFSDPDNREYVELLGSFYRAAYEGLFSDEGRAAARNYREEFKNDWKNPPVPTKVIPIVEKTVGEKAGKLKRERGFTASGAFVRNFTKTY